MARIKLEARKLSANAKCVEGESILSMSVDNPNVPGNEALALRFREANDRLKQIRVEVAMLESEMKEKMAAQQSAMQEWTTAANALASFTEIVTDGDPAAMMSAGFGVRARRSPTLTLGAVEAVNVKLSGEPGYSDLRWPPLKGAVGYVIEGTDAPSAGGGWKHAGFSTRAKFTANGATPGVVHWYRVAALNAEGQGPWSMPAIRPVL